MTIQTHISNAILYCIKIIVQIACSLHIANNAYPKPLALRPCDLTTDPLSEQNPFFGAERDYYKDHPLQQHRRYLPPEFYCEHVRASLDKSVNFCETLIPKFF